jgi:lysophospholipase L1-like esterase
MSLPPSLATRLTRPFFQLAAHALPFLGCAVFAADTPAAKPFALKPNTLWVMAGDSITAQRQHTNYLEAFYRTRFPSLNVQFRNSGIGGNTTGSVLARFGYDIADWKPSVVSIELGMNDVGGGDDPSRYIDGMRQLLKKIREIPATPLLISSSPVNDGSTEGAWQSDRCRRIQPYTEALLKLAGEEDVLVVDQYTPLLNRWAANKIRAELGRLKTYAPALKKLGLGETEPGMQELEGFLQKWNGSANARELGGDPVHPGPVGQLTMAAVILTKLGAPREVSSATLDQNGNVEQTSGCKVYGVESGATGLKFTRLDESSPWPIPVQARDALVVMPEIADLSRYMLCVKGLAEGSYQILMDEGVAAEVTAGQLSAGINLGAAPAGTFAARSTDLYNLINNLQGSLNNRWRDASKAKDAASLAAAAREIALAETALSEACKPKPIQFVVRKMK